MQWPMGSVDLDRDQRRVRPRRLNPLYVPDLRAGLEHVAARDETARAWERDLHRTRRRATDAHRGKRERRAAEQRDEHRQAEQQPERYLHSTQSIPSGPSDEALKN